jgi:hypothetical protein
MIASNLRNDPRGIWRIVRNTVIAVVAIMVLIFVIALIASAIG